MKDSLVYLEVLQYIKKNNINEFKRLYSDVEKIYFDEISVSEYIVGSKKAELLDKIVKDNLNLIKFLRSISSNQIDFFSSEFRFFIIGVELNLDKIDMYIENAKKLVDLEIDHMKFLNTKTYILKESGLKYDKNIMLNAYSNNDNQLFILKRVI